MEGNRVIQVYPDKSDPPEFRWRKWRGSDIVAESGEGYSDKQGAMEAAEKENDGTYEIEFTQGGGEPAA